MLLPLAPTGRLRAPRDDAHPIAAWHPWRWVFVIVCLVLIGKAITAAPEDFDQLLKKTDTIKTSNPDEFAKLMDLLGRETNNLSDAQRQYLNYLNSWRTAYRGDYSAAIQTLKAIIADPADVTLQFRARATVVNVLAIATQYEEAFTQLGLLIDQLPSISDGDAREQGLVAAAVLYNRVDQYDLGINYAQQMISDNWNGKGVCKGGQLKLEALYRSGRIGTAVAELQPTIDACVKINELIYANVVRLYLARHSATQGRYDDAIALAKEHYEEVLQTKYPPLISGYESFLAYAHREIGDSATAKLFAIRATTSAIKNEYTEPLVNTYRLLYVMAKEQGDIKSALAFHEKYAAADKGYLDDVSARQLAFQRATHESTANKMQIDTLNKQNEVLKLRQALADKAVETSRLYITMLVMGLAFVGFMAYRTKRSQMHFMNLSRLDGLTGMCNRPHFMDIAERALLDSKRSGHDTCVIICDLDYFKRINDTFGHAAGDTALKQTAATFQAHLRKQDIVGRLGGEEFSMVLIDCDAAAAQQRCDQIRVAIAGISIGDGSGAFKLSASFGIVSTANAGHELRRLLADADSALYQAKLSGRNRVVLHASSFAVQTEPAADPLPQGQLAAH